nr:YtfJ family protein [uncultured Haemophilus sp.]
MKKTTLALISSAILFSGTAFANSLKLEQSLPQVSVTDKGEIVLNGKDIAFQPWKSTALNGKVRIVHHLAGRSAAKEKNQAVIDAIKAAHFNQAKYQTTTIINSDDAVVGTGLFVKSSAENGKKENPHSQVVLDDQSSVKNAWGLKGKESAIIVLDKNGKVKFVKEGKLSNDEIQSVIGLVKTLAQ